MKKQWIALLTGCVLVCSMLAGCGSKPQTSAPAAAGSDKGCTDEAILSQLKNDGTPEFVLDGTYYTLPLETSQLIQAGWSLETEEYDASEVSLQPGERIYGELSKDDQEIDPEKIITDGEDKTATNMNDQTLWTRLWLIEENEDNVVAVVFDLETFSMESYTKVE